jgi:hypothetical protein
VNGTIEEEDLAGVVVVSPACVNPAGVDVVVYVVMTADGGAPKGEVTFGYSVDRMVIVEICVTGAPGGLPLSATDLSTSRNISNIPWRTGRA